MQRHEMIEAMRSLGLKGMAGAFDEAVTTGLQRKRTTNEILTDLLRAEAAHRHAASIRYRMANNIELSLEAANLTNEAQESWVANPSVSLPLEYGETGRTYLLGMRYTF